MARSNGHGQRENKGKYKEFVTITGAGPNNYLYILETIPKMAENNSLPLSVNTEH